MKPTSSVCPANFTHAGAFGMNLSEKDFSALSPRAETRSESFANSRSLGSVSTWTGLGGSSMLANANGSSAGPSTATAVGAGAGRVPRLLAGARGGSLSEELPVHRVRSQCRCGSSGTGLPFPTAPTQGSLTSSRQVGHGRCAAQDRTMRAACSTSRMAVGRHRRSRSWPDRRWHDQGAPGRGARHAHRLPAVQLGILLDALSDVPVAALPGDLSDVLMAALGGPADVLLAALADVLADSEGGHDVAPTLAAGGARGPIDQLPQAGAGEPRRTPACCARRRSSWAGRRARPARRCPPRRRWPRS